MQYVNGGVYGAKTKTALKSAVRNGWPIVFYGTSELGPQWEGNVGDVPEGVSLSVCGPDPYTDRRWWAQISRSKDGKVKVS
jgi:hypothetical protein